MRSDCDSLTPYTVSRALRVPPRTCDTLGVPTFTPGLPKYALGMSKGGCVVLTSALIEVRHWPGRCCRAWS